MLAFSLNGSLAIHSFGIPRNLLRALSHREVEDLFPHPVNNILFQGQSLSASPSVDGKEDSQSFVWTRSGSEEE